MNKTLTVVDSVTVGGKANLNGDVNIGNRLFAQNNVFLYRDITTSAGITAGSLTATGFIKGNYQDGVIPRTAISNYGEFLCKMSAFPRKNVCR